ncbi:MAG: MBL fold metallo-hydrolase [Acidimicrobiia bacterium]|nr:MBL fold metallo-hydrolase [Acidimicrobiia bacterium]
MSPFEEVGDRVFRRHYDSFQLNIGVVLGAEAVLLVDTRENHRRADELRGELGALTELPVAWVVNSHYHWDHTWGNSRFPEALIWGHDRCRSEMVENGEAARRQVLEWMPAEQRPEVEEVVITPPTETFPSSALIDIGGRVVELRYHGLGHTNSDIVVRVTDAGVLFAGDLIEEGAPPSFGDSYPLDWAQTLDSIKLEHVIVPGHGTIVDAPFVATQQEEIEGIADAARLGHSEGIPFESLIADGPYPTQTMRQALARAYAQLDGELSPG